MDHGEKTLLATKVFGMGCGIAHLYSDNVSFCLALFLNFVLFVQNSIFLRVLLRRNCVVIAYYARTTIQCDWSLQQHGLEEAKDDNTPLCRLRSNMDRVIVSQPFWLASLDLANDNKSYINLDYAINCISG